MKHSLFPALCAAVIAVLPACAKDSAPQPDLSKAAPRVVSLSASEYVLLCMATAPDGRSHIEHGMVRQFTVQ